MSTALKLLSFDDLYRQLRALPPGRNGEIINGELVTSPRPAVPHASSGGEIFADLRSRFRRKPGESGPPSGWWILPEPELHLEAGGRSHVLSPDIAGWKRERMPLVPRAAWIGLTPDWICEVLSPSTAHYDKRQKARIYHQAGVTWRWLVDPASETLDAYRREGDVWMLLGSWGNEEAARIEPFDEFELDLRYWWDGLEPLPEG